MVPMMPEIPDCWKSGVKETAAVLGICRETLRKYMKMGVMQGGIAYRISPRNGRPVFTGKEIKRFWLRCV